MTKTSEENGLLDQGAQPTYRVRLPGFLMDKEIGLGDAIKSATSYMGIKPCGGCAKRASVLNRWMVFTNRPQP